MAGLLGLPVLLEALASLGQRYDQAKGLLSNPSVTLRDLAQANAAQRAQDQSWVGASQSVMPEVRAAAQERGMQAALNVGGLLGMVAPKTQYELAQEIAQKNAAKPYEQGGLGLRPDNTALERARAMGFDTAPSKQVYHGTKGEINGPIDPSLSDFGFHVGTADQAMARLRAGINGGEGAYDEGSNILPILMSKYANLLKVKDEGSFHADALAPQLEKKKLIARGKGKQIQQDVDADWKKAKQYDEQLRGVLDQAGYDGIKYANEQEGAGMSYAISNPAVIRSRFAAFDPAQKNSRDLMATLAALGLLGSGYATNGDQ